MTWGNVVASRGQVPDIKHRVQRHIVTRRGMLSGVLHFIPGSQESGPRISRLTHCFAQYVSGVIFIFRRFCNCNRAGGCGPNFVFSFLVSMDGNLSRWRDGGSLYSFFLWPCPFRLGIRSLQRNTIATKYFDFAMRRSFPVTVWNLWHSSRKHRTYHLWCWWRPFYRNMSIWSRNKNL